MSAKCEWRLVGNSEWKPVDEFEAGYIPFTLEPLGTGHFGFMAVIAGKYGHVPKSLYIRTTINYLKMLIRLSVGSTGRGLLEDLR